jgi:hypothetical protein
MSTVMEYSRNVTKNIPEFCTTVGPLNFYNVTFMDSMVYKVVPSGYYMVTFNDTDDYDERLLDAMLMVVLTK